MTRYDTEVGFEITGPILDANECDALIDLLERSRFAGRAGYRSLLSVPEISQLAEDRRLTLIAQRFLGAKPVPYKAVLFEKTSSTNWLVPWHQDRVLPLADRNEDPEWGPWTVKEGIHFAHAPAWALNSVIALRIHLDDSTLSNGPLRVIPDTYRLGVLPQRRVVETAGAIPTVTCTAPRGGVIAIRPLTIHASSKSTCDRSRRVLHVEYAASLRLAPQIELALS